MEAYFVFLIAYIIIPGGTTGDTVRLEPEGGGLNHCYRKNGPSKTWCHGAGTLSCSGNTGRLSNMLTAIHVMCSGSFKCNQQCCTNDHDQLYFEMELPCVNKSHCNISLPELYQRGCLCNIKYNCTYSDEHSTTSSPSTTSVTATTVAFNSTRAHTAASNTSNSSNNPIASEIESDTTPVAAIVVPVVLVLVLLATALGAYCLRHKDTCCANYKTDHASTTAMSNAAYIDQPDDGIIIAKHSPSDYTGYSEIGPRVTSISYHANTDSLQPPCVTSNDYDVMTMGTQPVMPDPTYNHLAPNTPVYSRVVGKHADLTYDRIGGMDTTQSVEKASFDGNIYNTTRLEGFAMDSSKPEKIFGGENVYDHAVNNQADCPRDTVTVNNDIPEDKNGEKSVKHEYFVLERVQRDL